MVSVIVALFALVAIYVTRTAGETDARAAQPASQAATHRQLPRYGLRFSNSEAVPPLSVDRLNAHRLRRATRLASPRARAHRRASRHAYGRLSRRASARLVSRTFPRLMTARGIDRSGLLHGKRARAYRGKHVALVGTKAHPALAMSSVPLVRRTARSAFAAPRPVDLSLDQTAEGFSPGNPVVPADFPEQLNDPMTVGSAGIAIRVNPDEPGNPTGSLIAGGDVVFYPDAARDTDVLAQAAAEGLEISACRAPRFSVQSS